MDLKKYKLRFILLMIYKAKMDSAKFGTVHFYFIYENYYYLHKSRARSRASR